MSNYFLTQFIVSNYFLTLFFIICLFGIYQFWVRFLYMFIYMFVFLGQISKLDFYFEIVSRIGYHCHEVFLDYMWPKVLDSVLSLSTRYVYWSILTQQLPYHCSFSGKTKQKNPHHHHQPYLSTAGSHSFMACHLILAYCFQPSSYLLYFFFIT